MIANDVLRCVSPLKVQKQGNRFRALRPFFESPLKEGQKLNR